MDRHFRTSLAAMAAGLVVIFSGGVLWLAKDLGLEAALSVGLVPFVVVDTVKILAAATVMPAAWRVVRD
jgi:biotin transport system substrate-specific component